MRKIRGFKLKHRVTTLFRFFLRRNRSTSGYRRLDPPNPNPKPISTLFTSLKTKAKSLCCPNPGRISGRGYVPMNSNHRLVEVPKGQMAVYVGQKDGEDFRRVLVPVVYFNHPLFGELLREVEQEFGFDHSGGITIPCRISDFENVKTRIAAGRAGRNLLTWKKGS